jgi:D-isomer specific 2-hydroxyacid dehydrogenase, catalytic domain.
MKIAAYEVREDERPYFDRQSKTKNIEIMITDLVLNSDTLSMAQGCQALTSLGESQLNAALLDEMHIIGIKYICTRTIAKALGMYVSNVRYAPTGWRNTRLC